MASCSLPSQECRRSWFPDSGSPQSPRGRHCDSTLGLALETRGTSKTTRSIGSCGSRGRASPAAGPTPALRARRAGPLSWLLQCGMCHLQNRTGVIVCPLLSTSQSASDFQALTDILDPPPSGATCPTKTPKPRAASRSWGPSNMMTSVWRPYRGLQKVQAPGLYEDRGQEGKHGPGARQ